MRLPSLEALAADALLQNGVTAQEAASLSHPACVVAALEQVSFLRRGEVGRTEMGHVL